MHKLLLPLAAAALLGALLGPVNSIAQPAAPQQELQDVQKRLQESRERERELGREAAKLAQKQRDLQKKLVAAARKLQAQEDLVSQSEDKLAGLLADEAAAREALEAPAGVVISDIDRISAEIANVKALAKQSDNGLSVIRFGIALDAVA